MTNLDQDDRMSDEIDWQFGGDDQKPEESTSDADAEAKEQSEGEREGDANTTEQADAQSDEDAQAEPTGDDESGDSDEQPEERPKPSKWQRKKAKYTEQIAGKDAEIAALKRRLQDLEENTQSPPEPPKEEDFEDFAAFERAQIVHDVRAATQEDNQNSQKQAIERELEQKQADRIAEARQNFNDRVKESESEMPEYAEKIEALDARLGRANASLPPHVQELILDSEKGPQILYMMAGDDGLLMQMMGSTPTSAALEIGRREALLGQPKPPKTTKAPPPVKAPKGGTEGTVDPTAMSYSDYKKWRGQS